MFCQKMGMEKQQRDGFDASKVVGTLVQCVVVVEPPSDSCQHSSNIVIGYLPSLFD
jgi:hypothetical protein